MDHGKNTTPRRIAGEAIHLKAKQGSAFSIATGK
jgi:hypothetical protein